MNSLHQYTELIIFDTETTGLYPESNHIIELGCCKYTLQNKKFVLTDEMNELIQVNYPIPQNIQTLTNITDEMLQKEGKKESEVVHEFVSKFIKNSTNKKLFMAYNAPFDIHFINALLTRHHFAFPQETDFLDILTVYKDRASYPHKLMNAIEHYRLSESYKNSHRAIDDVYASFAVLESMASEKDDLLLYVNLFGYNPKYPPVKRIANVKFKPQPYNAKNPLYL